MRAMLSIAVVSIFYPSAFALEKAPTKTDSAVPLQMNGAVLSDSSDIAVVALTSTKTGRAGWFRTGQKIEGYTIKSFTTDEIILESADGQKSKVMLKIAPIELSKSPESPPPRYSKAWINSRENPMLKMIIPLPSDVISNWGQMTTEEKSRIIEFFKNHGWQLKSSQVVNGDVDFVWHNIYEEERVAVIRANVAAFKVGLTEQQSELWARAIASSPTPMLGGPVRPTDPEVTKARERNMEAFLASLSDKQREAHNSIGDFTRADWNK